jgi:hypothetical protein
MSARRNSLFLLRRRRANAGIDESFVLPALRRRSDRQDDSRATMNERTARARSARPASVTLSRTAHPAISAPAFSTAVVPGEIARGRAVTGGCTPDSAAHVKPEHHASAARPLPSVKQPTVRTDRPSGTHARPLCVRGPRNNPVHSATR